MLSVYPRKRFPGAKQDPNISIQAINKSKIPTFGKTSIQIRMGRKTYNHVVTLADIDQPVLGWDFCRKFRLSLIWNEIGDLELYDAKANIRVPLQLESNSGNGLIWRGTLYCQIR